MASDDEEIAALSSKDGSPLEERIRHRRDGPYYIAPDSAEPLPDSIWQRIDLDVLSAAIDRANAREHAEQSKADVAFPCVLAETDATGGRRRQFGKGQATLAKVRKMLPR